jgi:hypothetical protein
MNWRIDLRKGMKKLEKNPSAARDSDGMFSIRYDFRNDTAPMIRSEVFRALNVKAPKHDLVIIIERRPASRVFLNAEEIEQYMLSKCEFCEIRRIDFADFSIQDQVRLAASATVLVGMHGSGLSHVLWMENESEKVPTALVEIIPHAFFCWDWFEGAAAIARVKYYRVMSENKGIGSNVTVPELERLKLCWKHLSGVRRESATTFCEIRIYHWRLGLSAACGCPSLAISGRRKRRLEFS